jgi:CheY-like chemotaxis protein
MNMPVSTQLLALLLGVAGYHLLGTHPRWAWWFVALTWIAAGGLGYSGLSISTPVIVLAVAINYSSLALPIGRTTIVGRIAAWVLAAMAFVSFWQSGAYIVGMLAVGAILLTLHVSTGGRPLDAEPGTPTGRSVLSWFRGDFGSPDSATAGSGTPTGRLPDSDHRSSVKQIDPSTTASEPVPTRPSVLMAHSDPSLPKSVQVLTSHPKRALSSLVPAKILIANGAASVADLLARALALADHHVSVVADGRSAVEHLRFEPCDLLLTELNLPDMDGFTLIQQARRLNPDLRVALISDLLTEAGRNEAVALGVTAFVTKPFRIPAVLAAAANALKERAAN